MVKKKIVTALSSFAFLLSFQSFAQDDSVQSQSTQYPTDSLVQRVEGLNQQVKILERLRDVDQENNQKKIDETPVVSAGKDGFSLRAPDTSYQLKIKFEGHFDGRTFFDADTFRTNRQSTAVVRRARPIIEAKIPGPFYFRLMADLANGKVDIPDAYVESGFDPRLGFRIGKFKSPFSIEVLQSTTAVPFLELSLASQLAPNRDIGAIVQGEFGKGLVSYAAGVLNGVADGSSLDGDWNKHKDLAGRIFLQPFQKVKALSGLGIGTALTYGNHSDPRDPKKWSSTTSPVSVSGFKSAGQESIFKFRDTTFASGNQTRYSIQGYYYVSRLGLIGEYINSTLSIKQKSSVAEISNSGWSFAAVFSITGEANGYKSIKPFRNFNPAKGQLGAFELAGRISTLDIDKDVFPVFADSTKQIRSATEYTGGVNWILNRNVKFLLDYTQTEYTGGAKKGNAPAEKLLAGRVQVAF